MATSQQTIHGDDQWWRKKWRFLLLLLFIGLILGAVGTYYFIGGKAAVKKTRLSEAMYVIDSKQDLLIKDSAVLKAIALDSLNFINQIEQPASSILVDTASFFAQLTELQGNKLAEIRQLEFNSNAVPGKMKLGITSKSFTPLQFLTGERGGPLPAADLALLTSHCSNAAQYPFLKFGGVPLNPTVRKMDIRAFGVTSSTIDQAPHVVCWAIAAAKAFDINYQINHHNQKIISSQQQIIDCSKGGNTISGNSYKVFSWLEDPSVLLTDSSAYPFTGTFSPNNCWQPAAGRTLKDWSLILCGTSGDTAPIKRIKDAICRFGSVVSAVQTTRKWLHYQDEDDILQDPAHYHESDGSFSSDHSVLIIGWDDDKQAWLVKNSWGEGWGITGGIGAQRGYMWVDYKSYNIGLRACWVLAR